MECEPAASDDKSVSSDGELSDAVSSDGESSDAVSSDGELISFSDDKSVSSDRDFIYSSVSLGSPLTRKLSCSTRNPEPSRAMHIPAPVYSDSDAVRAATLPVLPDSVELPVPVVLLISVELPEPVVLLIPMSPAFLLN